MNKISFSLIALLGIVACSGCPSGNPNRGIGTSPNSSTEETTTQSTGQKTPPWESLVGKERELYEVDYMCPAASIVAETTMDQMKVVKDSGKKFADLKDGSTILSVDTLLQRDCAEGETADDSNSCWKTATSYFRYNPNTTPKTTPIAIETALDTSANMLLIDYFTLKSSITTLGKLSTAGLIEGATQATGEYFCVLFDSDNK